MDDEDYLRITLRMPAALHARLVADARRTSKSMNAEIIGRLEQSFRAEDAAQLPGLAERIDKQVAELDALFEKLEGKVSRLNGLVLKSEAGAGKAGRQLHEPVAKYGKGK